jgi:hypothetical protein
LDEGEGIKNGICTGNNTGTNCGAIVPSAVPGGNVPMGIIPGGKVSPRGVPVDVVPVIPFHPSRFPGTMMGLNIIGTHPASFWKGMIGGPSGAAFVLGSPDLTSDGCCSPREVLAAAFPTKAGLSWACLERASPLEPDEDA